MSHLALNLVLALIWTLLSGRFTIDSVLFGFAAGFAALFLLRPALGSDVYIRSVGWVGRLIAIYISELFVASLQLARDILTRGGNIRGGFFQFDSSALSPTRTVLLSNMLSLTPGTLTVDIADDGNSLYIHTVYANQMERSRRSVQLFHDLIAGIGRGGPQPKHEEIERWRPGSS